MVFRLQWLVDLSHASPENWQLSWWLDDLGDSLLHMSDGWQAVWRLAKLSAGAPLFPSVWALILQQAGLDSYMWWFQGSKCSRKRLSSNVQALFKPLLYLISYWARSVTWPRQAYHGKWLPKMMKRDSHLINTAHLVKSFNFGKP